MSVDERDANTQASHAETVYIEVKRSGAYHLDEKNSVLAPRILATGLFLSVLKNLPPKDGEQKNMERAYRIAIGCIQDVVQSIAATTRVPQECGVATERGEA